MFQKIIYLTIQLFVAVILTILTQVGGVIYLLCLPLFRYINRKAKSKLNAKLIKILAFAIIYIGATFLIIPPLAKMNGRIPLPTIIDEEFMVCPISFVTVIGNRHYVSTEMHDVLKKVSITYQQKHPNAIISYLDANFPFIDGFPLIPHLSHNDGEKVDLAFMYKDAETGEPLNNKAKAFMGYGIYEKPKFGEFNQADECEKNGFKQYSSSSIFGIGFNQNSIEFDEERTADLVNAILANNVGKIFIEPHLKTRMGLYHNKIRFHGCHAVRHDDHIHIQL